MSTRIHVFYTGRVQGVGFRFTAEDLARQLGAVGWVRNLGDGRVELVVEADESTLQELLSRIRDDFGQYIQDVDVSWQEPTGEFKDFGIRF